MRRQCAAGYVRSRDRDREAELENWRKSARVIYSLYGNILRYDACTHIARTRWGTFLPPNVRLTNWRRWCLCYMHTVCILWYMDKYSKKKNSTHDTNKIVEGKIFTGVMDETNETNRKSYAKKRLTYSSALDPKLYHMQCTVHAVEWVAVTPTTTTFRVHILPQTNEPSATQQNKVGQDTSTL